MVASANPPEAVLRRVRESQPDFFEALAIDVCLMLDHVRLLLDKHPLSRRIEIANTIDPIASSYMISWRMKQRNQMSQER